MSLKQVNDYTLQLALKGGYYYVNQKLKSDDEHITYTIFENRHGEWFIEREDVSPSDGGVERRYTKGDSDYATSWIARETLDYFIPSVSLK